MNVDGFQLGVDVGGTFTDFVLWSPDRDEVRSLKVLTTPDRPSRAIFEGLDRICGEAGIEPARISRLVHATTLVANAIIERTGARTALVSTAGFRDILQFRRELRYDLFEPHLEFPVPLVPRRLRLELPERVDAEGTPLRVPSRDDVEALAEEIRRLGAESVAICLLHSYVNPAHEELVGRALAEAAPELFVSLSSRVLRQLREYERTSATVINAYVQPMAKRYLAELDRGLRERGCPAEVLVVTSTGGTVGVETAEALPILLVESGPAAGVVFASSLSQEAGYGNVVAFDMGGTTAKVSIVKGGRPRIQTDQEVARTRRFKLGSGLPVGIPVLDLLEVGAGGGSIAELDVTGLVRVGPRSAGASPGPACYGLGGTEPTVTDASLVLGYLDEEAFLGGERRLDRAAAERALAERLARPAGMDLLQAALAVYRIVTETMAEALRVRSAEVNVDVRQFALMAFGGAAGIHAVEVARRLGIERLVCPARAGVFAAAGLLVAPLAVELSRSWIVAVSNLDAAAVQALFAELEEQGARLFESVGAAPVEREYSADMSYVGQGFEIRVPFRELPGADGEVERLAEWFHEEYERAYGRRLDGYAARVVTWWLRLAGPDQHAPSLRRERAERAEPGRREIFLDGAWVAVPVYERATLHPGDTLAGPLVVQDVDSTLVLPRGTRLRVDGLTSLLVDTRWGG